MQTIEWHTTDVGPLTFVVCRGDDGDIALGFEGFAWHTHADILASLSGLPEAEAVRCYIDDLLHDRTVIAVSRIGTTIRDVWLSDDPISDLKYNPEQETIEFRYWSGRPAGTGL